MTIRAGRARVLAVLLVTCQAAHAFVNANRACGRRRRRPAGWPAARGTDNREPAGGRDSCGPAANHPASREPAGIARPRSCIASGGRTATAKAGRFPAWRRHAACAPAAAGARRRRCIEWHARQGMAGRLVSRASVKFQGPWVSMGCTRSRMPPAKCMPWHRRQSSIRRRWRFCLESVKILAYVDGVWPAPPLRKFLLVARLAAVHHGSHVLQPQVNLLRHVALRVPHHAAQIAGQRTAVALLAVKFAMRRVPPGVEVGADFVTSRAAFAPGRAIVQVCTRN